MGEQGYSNYAEPVQVPGRGREVAATVLAIASIVVYVLAFAIGVWDAKGDVTVGVFILGPVLAIVALVLNTWCDERHTLNIVLSTICLSSAVTVFLMAVAAAAITETPGSPASQPAVQSAPASTAERGDGGQAAGSVPEGTAGGNGNAPASQGAAQQGTQTQQGASPAETAQPEPTQPADSASADYEEVDLATFFAELDTNQARVASAYKGKLIKFTGYATDISLNPFDSNEVDVKVSDEPPTGFDVLGVNCEITDPALKEVAYGMLPGDRVVVTGRFTSLHDSWINSFEVDSIEML